LFCFVDNAAIGAATSNTQQYDVDDALAITEESFVTFKVKRYNFLEVKSTTATATEDQQGLGSNRFFDYVLL